jgi:hypothetical protein
MTQLRSIAAEKEQSSMAASNANPTTVAAVGDVPSSILPQELARGPG